MSKRLSVILTDADEHRLAPFLAPGTAEHDALRSWADERGVRNASSEASVIRLLLQAGADALQDNALDAGYAELALSYGDSHANAERRAARDRHVQRTQAAPAPR